MFLLTVLTTLDRYVFLVSILSLILISRVSEICMYVMYCISQIRVDRMLEKLYCDFHCFVVYCVHDAVLAQVHV